MGILFRSPEQKIRAIDTAIAKLGRAIQRLKRAKLAVKAHSAKYKILEMEQLKLERKSRLLSLKRRKFFAKLRNKLQCAKKK